MWDVVQKQNSSTSTGSENILLRRLSHTVRLYFHTFLETITALGQAQTTLRHEPTSNANCFSGPLPPAAKNQPIPPDVLEGLSSIKSTPFNHSFASRLYGGLRSPATIFFKDWDTMSPWMELMADLMDHYRLSQFVWLSPGIRPYLS